ncbi:lipocalin family protein [Lutimonas sp.]
MDIPHDYRCSIVGHPKRDYLWILCRTPHMDNQTYTAIVDRIKKKNRC